MKKLLKLILALALLAAGAAAVLMVMYPDTEAGQFVRKWYDVARAKAVEQWSKAFGEAAAPEAESGEAKPAPAAKPAAARPAAAKPAADALAAKPDVPAAAAEPAVPAGPVRGVAACTDGNWYSGRKLTEVDLKGKVVLFYVWNAEDGKSASLLKRIQKIWDSYKTKPFVVVASHRGGRSQKAAKILNGAGITFSAYDNAGAAAEPETIPEMPFIYIVNHKGRLIYRGNSEREATAKAVSAITDAMLD